MTLCIDTETTVIDSIDESIQETFQMMAGEALIREGESCRVDSAKYHAKRSGGEISVVMGLTGGLQGSVSLSMTHDAAIRWTDALIDHKASEIDQTVIDAVGELGNMVVGGAKRRLCDYGLTMSLPSVIRVGADGISYPQSDSAILVSYQYGESTIEALIALQSKA